jgi:hypothetical protein
MAARFKKVNKQQVEAQERKMPKAVDPWSIQQIIPSAYMEYGDGSTGMKGLQQYAKDLTLDQRAAAAAGPAPKEPKMGALDKGSAAIWAVLSAIGGQLKDEVGQLKNDPMGSLKATVDAYTVGPEARSRFKQGDYAGAINQSGLGQLAALPELENIFKGKGSPSDLAWLAATYGTGGIGKAAKAVKAPVKKAVKRGTTKAYTNIVNRIK